MTTSISESINKISTAASFSAGFAIAGAIMSTSVASLALFGLVSSIIPICLLSGVSKQLNDVELLYSDRNSIINAVMIITALVLVKFSMIGSYYLLTNLGLMIPLNAKIFFIGVGLTLVIKTVVSLAVRRFLKTTNPIDVYAKHPLGRIKLFSQMVKRNDLDENTKYYILQALEREIEIIESNKEYEELIGYKEVNKVLNIAKELVKSLHAANAFLYSSLPSEA